VGKKQEWGMGRLGDGEFGSGKAEGRIKKEMGRRNVESESKRQSA